ncbi:MAG: hypothetical protein SNJ58_08420 [Aggregatilineales bacterium]
MLRRAWFVLLFGAALAISLLSLPSAPLGAVQVTPAPTLARITVGGRIQAGTDGLQLPVGAPVTLHVLRAATADAQPVLIQQLQTALNADGTFRFENLAFQTGDLIFASLRYDGAQQASPIVKLEAPLRDFELPIVLYARTEDASAIQIVRAQHTFEFPSESMAQILSVYLLRAQGDRFFMTEQSASNGKNVSARLPLPIGAVAVAFDPALNDSLAIGGSTIAPEVLLTRPLFPGELYEVIFSYQLPFRDGATIDQDYPYRAEQVQIRLPQDANAALTSQTQRFRQSSEAVQATGRTYQVYQLERPMLAAERLIFTLTRRLPQTPQPSVRMGSEDTTWFAVLVLGLVLIGVFGGAVWLMQRLLRR